MIVPVFVCQELRVMAHECERVWETCFLGKIACIQVFCHISLVCIVNDCEVPGKLSV